MGVEVDILVTGPEGPPAMKEQAVESHLIGQVRALGGLAVKHVSPGRAGDPDRLVAIPRRPCPACGSRARVGLIELKRPGEVPRPLQLARLIEWQDLGVPAGWADTKQGVDLVLQQFGRIQ